MRYRYKVIGATCGSCGEKIKNSLSELEEVIEVDYDNETKTISLTVTSRVDLSQLQKKLVEDYSSKYKLVGVEQSLPQVSEIKSIKTYWPLILVVLYILFGSVFGMWLLDDWSWQFGMRLFMGLFFMAFAFFKLLDIPGFAMSYLGYDIIAQKWIKWGYVYPFVELGLGLAYLFNLYPVVTNGATLVVMIIGLIGVTRAVLSKREIRCVCLGTGFNLPMSTVTIIEDAVMAIMALIMLINLYV